MSKNMFFKQSGKYGMKIKNGVFASAALPVSIFVFALIGFLSFGVMQANATIDYVAIFNAVDATLLSQGIASNIDTCGGTPTACAGLYFEKSGIGKISFAGTLDLTDATTVATLQSLNTGISFSDGEIIFTAIAGDVFETLGGSLEMYNLDSATTPTIYVNDVVAGSGDVNGVSYNPNTGTLTFTALHFSKFSTHKPSNGKHHNRYFYYKTSLNKIRYNEAKLLKKTNMDEFLRIQDVYRKYKRAGDKAINNLPLKTLEKFRAYRGYVNYKLYRGDR